MIKSLASNINLMAEIRSISSNDFSSESIPMEWKGLIKSFVIRNCWWFLYCWRRCIEIRLLYWLVKILTDSNTGLEHSRLHKLVLNVKYGQNKGEVVVIELLQINYWFHHEKVDIDCMHIVIPWNRLPWARCCGALCVVLWQEHTNRYKISTEVCLNDRVMLNAPIVSVFIFTEIAKTSH